VATYVKSLLKIVVGIERKYQKEVHSLRETPILNVYTDEDADRSGCQHYFKVEGEKYLRFLKFAMTVGKRGGLGETSL